jgi:uncharacterized protein YxjI
VRYVIKERFFAIGEDSDITDDSGEPIFQVDGKVLSLHNLLIINNTAGGEVGRVHRKLVAFVPTYEITVAGKDVAEVHKHFFSPIHDKFTIDVPGDNDLEMSGNVFEHDYTITRKGSTVATISKAWVSWTATYGVDIAEGEDDVLILGTVLALDLAEDRERAS